MQAKLKVVDAPEPSTIIWENLKYSTAEQRRRRLVAFIFAVGFICVSLFATYFAQALQLAAKSTAGEDLCPTDWYVYIALCVCVY